MGVIRINGVSYSGRSISINNGNITIDGKKAELKDEKVITIEVTGDIDKLSADECQTITVSGSCGSVSTMSGDVECGNIGGSVSTMSGDVSCGGIGGNVSTMSGDVRGV